MPHKATSAPTFGDKRAIPAESADWYSTGIAGVPPNTFEISPNFNKNISAMPSSFLLSLPSPRRAESHEPVEWEGAGERLRGGTPRINYDTRWCIEKVLGVPPARCP
jgi:hypothetical protein